MAWKKGLIPLWLISALTHGMAGYHYWAIKSSFPAPEEWTGQFYFLLGGSLVLSFVIFSVPLFSSRVLSSFVKIAFHFFLLIIIGLPFGEDMNIEFLLLAVILVETAFYVTAPYNFIISAMFIGLVFSINTRMVSVWGYTVSGASFLSNITLGFFAFFFALLGCLLRYFIEKLYAGESGRRRLEESVTALTAANMDFQHYAIKAEENSMIQERKRISREIHDTVGYTLTNIIMMMQAAMDMDTEDYEKVRVNLLQTRNQAQSGLKETRRALRELRSMDEQSRIGLKALYYLTSTFQRATGVEVMLESGNTPWSLGEEIDQVIYRLVQEGMTNSFRHGQASRIVINLWLDMNGVSVAIQDNGKGCANITEGIGISGMKERISAFQGYMNIGNTAQGFKVAAFLPVRRDETDLLGNKETHGKDEASIGG